MAIPTDPQKSNNSDQTQQLPPPGVVLGPDGKPCKTCTSTSAWAAAFKRAAPLPSKSSSTTTPSTSATSSSIGPQTECPPDVELLGRSTWTLLHTLTAQYPTHPSASQQASARNFISALSELYPCWSCAKDFREWLAEDKNAPRVSSRGDFGRWMCEAHNAVNTKLGKEVFDCGRWEERWRTGWRDGSCD